MEEENYEMMFKVVLVGDSSVGKTNIMSKYLKNEFHEDSKATVGVEFGSKQFTIEGHQIKAQIWDTAGQERYKAITSAYYKGAKGAFVVYDITRKQSFDSVDRWINDLKAAADKKLSVIIIGNKCDLEDQRQVTKEQGEEKAKNNEVAFMETSAYSGENLDKAFEKMMNEVFKKCHEEMMSEGDLDIVGPSKDISLDKTKPKNALKSGKKKILIFVLKFIINPISFTNNIPIFIIFNSFSITKTIFKLSLIIISIFINIFSISFIFTINKFSFILNITIFII